MEPPISAPTRRSTRTRRQVQSIYDDAKGEKETMSITRSNNRKKIRTADAPLPDPSIYNVPDSVMIHIAGFVNNMSRLLLTAALTASPKEFIESNWKIKPCAAARVILNHKFDRYSDHSCINFYYSDEELASRLSDEDIGAVLTCISGICEITYVKLTNCVNVSGHFLGALRGSKDLKQLDLGFVEKKEYPKVNHLESKISEQCVIPILDGIINTEGCSLKHIRFPKKWREEQSELLGKFLFRYNRAANKRNIPCKAGSSYKACTQICSGTARNPWISKTGNMFGTYNFTCYSCEGSFCTLCVEEWIPDEICEKCETRKCNGCAPTKNCDACGETTCYKCSWIDTCESCDDTTCGECCLVSHCEYCDKTRCEACCRANVCNYPGCKADLNCAECSEKDHYFMKYYEMTKYCSECKVSYCGDHLLKCVVNDPDIYCSDCRSRVAVKLSEENEMFVTRVLRLENTYATKGDCCTSSGDDIKQGIDTRKELLQRYHSIGMLLTPMQKQYENFDWGSKLYEIS